MSASRRRDSGLFRFGDEADAPTWGDGPGAEVHGRTEGPEEASREAHGRPQPEGGEEGELVPAEARHGPARVHRIPHPGRDGLEEPVAGVVPERVVNGLELVEVDEKDGEGVARREGLLDLGAELGPVGEAREAVVERQVSEAGRHPALGRHVADDGEHPLGIAGLPAHCARRTET